MPSNCPHCSAPLSEDDQLTDLGLFSCPKCGSMSYPGSSPVAASADGKPPWERKRAMVDLPTGVKLAESPGGLQITVYWLSARGVVHAVSVVVVMLMAVAWYGLEPSVREGLGTPSWVGWLLGAGLAIALYDALARLINRTTFTVTRGTLGVRNGPLPWRGNQRLPTAAIDQLYVRQHVRKEWRRKRSGLLTVGRSSRLHRVEVITYQVWLLRKDGHKRRLLGRLASVEQAMVVEQRIEEWLGIEDRAVTH